MLAAFDIGNTGVSVGFFDGPTLRCAYSLTSDVHRAADEYRVLLGALLADEGVGSKQVHGAAIASTVPRLTETFERMCVRLFGVRPLVVGAGTRTGVRINTRNPREVGPDRVVNAVAVHHQHGGPAIVVDFGTPTTFDVIGADGAYLGTAIAPGLAISAEALFQHASRLHRVDLVCPKSAIGKDTTSALQSGLVFGHVALVEGMIARLQAELGQRCRVIATGDLAPLIARETTVIERVEPHLALVGLRVLYELNHDADVRIAAEPSDAHHTQHRS